MVDSYDRGYVTGRRAGFWTRALLVLTLLVLIGSLCCTPTGPAEAIILVENTSSSDLVSVTVDSREVLDPPPLRSGTRLRVVVVPGCHTVTGWTLLGGSGTARVCPTERDPKIVRFQ